MPAFVLPIKKECVQTPIVRPLKETQKSADSKPLHINKYTKTMRTRKSQILVLVVGILGFTFSLNGQNGNPTPKLSKLPISLSWDDDGIRITARNPSDPTMDLLKVTRSRYLDQIGNNLIRVTLDTRNTPVVIDLTGYYQSNRVDESTAEVDTTDFVPQIRVYTLDVSLEEYSDPSSFAVELKNFTKEIKNVQQTFVFKGLDVFYVSSAPCAKRSANKSRIVVDVDDCRYKKLRLQGGVLDLEDLEVKIPTLCKRYNDRYYATDKSNAFICLQDCKAEGSESIKDLQHSRKLITKYNITDFTDEPISFLSDILITKKGIGINLKTTEESITTSRLKKRSSKVAFNAYDQYRFFPWSEFINLAFEKYVDDVQLKIRDPYNNQYIYNSQVYFSNVELIQFFNELKVLISAGVN